VNDIRAPLCAAFALKIFKYTCELPFTGRKSTDMPFADSISTQVSSENIKNQIGY
jgi:hypothetical protein